MRVVHDMLHHYERTGLVLCHTSAVRLAADHAPTRVRRAIGRSQPQPQSASLRGLGPRVSGPVAQIVFAQSHASRFKAEST